MSASHYSAGPWCSSYDSVRTVAKGKLAVSILLLATAIRPVEETKKVDFAQLPMFKAQNIFMYGT